MAPVLLHLCLRTISVSDWLEFVKSGSGWSLKCTLTSKPPNFQMTSHFLIFTDLWRPLYSKDKEFWIHFGYLQTIWSSAKFSMIVSEFTGFIYIKIIPWSVFHTWQGFLKGYSTCLNIFPVRGKSFKCQTL